MVREWKFSNGFAPALDFCELVSMSVDTALTDKQKDLFIRFSCSAASKVLTMGFDEGQMAIIANVGASNAVTIKNVAGDTGTSVAAGKVALFIGGSSTADTCKCYVLN